MPHVRRRLLAGPCPGCGQPLIHSGRSKKDGRAHCPECWSRLLAARNFGLSLKVGMIAADVDRIILRLANQRNRRVVEELTASSTVLKQLADEIVLTSWQR